MDARIAQPIAARIAGLNPFDMPGAAGEARQVQGIRTKAKERLKHPQVPEDELLDQPAEFGCVDWYLYPKRHPLEVLSAPD